MAEALEVLDRPGASIDAVVAAADLSGDDALRLAGQLRGGPDAPFLVITGLPPSDPILVQYLEAGADAYLTEELSLGGLLLVLRLLDRGEVLVAPPTAHLLVRRIHAMADLLEASGVDVSAMADLTSREKEVLDLLGHRLSNKEIAKRLYIGVGTVKSHVHSILGKLDVRDREEARKVLLLARSRAGGLPGESPPG